MTDPPPPEFAAPHPFSWTPDTFRITELCVGCGRESTHLCDAAIAIRPEGSRTWTGVMWTCDAPLCSECREVVGRAVIDDEVMALDRCPYHTYLDQHTWWRYFGHDRSVIRGPVVKSEHVDKIRRRVWHHCAADGRITGTYWKKHWIDHYQ